MKTGSYKCTSVIVMSVFAFILGVSFFWPRESDVKAAAGPEYKLIKVCKGPLFRHTREQVVERVKDGQHFYRNHDGRLQQLSDGYKMREVCK